MQSHKRNHLMAALESQQPSVAAASNIAVITQQTALDIEMQVGGKLSSKAIRDRIFDSTYLMLLVVIEPDWEAVTVYTRGIALGHALSVKEMKAISKSKGPDVAEILKAYQLGHNPSI